ncbi:MAG: hypothetical protein JNL39_11200 [Opitutaceae bacterium]|nr:hypothetical protein [Opitutaceae bacterium]
MNSDQEKRLFELFTAHAADSLTPAEHAELQETLRQDPSARRLWFVHQDVELGLRAQLAVTPTVPAAPAPVANPPRSIWRQWRPIPAAAAGVVLGILGASAVFGWVVQRGAEKRTPLAVIEPGFENTGMPLAKGVPHGAGQWGGDAALVVAEENGITPKEGRRMLRLEPAARGAPRIFHVLDLASPPFAPDGETREIEISASFASADSEAVLRYMLRAFAITEAPENIDATWFDRRDEAVASATRGLDVAPGARGWQTLGVSLRVPSAARSLVLFFGVRTPEKSLRTSPHYLDDVRVTLVTPPDSQP